MLNEATKSKEECGASHKLEAEVPWEHMDATFVGLAKREISAHGGII